MFGIFPYIFSTTFNFVAGNMDIIDNIVDNVMKSEFVENLVNNIESMTNVDVNFKEHKNGYTIDCYLPGVKKENIDLEYENNYVTLKIKRNSYYSTANNNVSVAVVRPGGDIEEDYYVEDVDPYNIKAAFKDNYLRVVIPKNMYFEKDTPIIEINDYTSNDTNIIDVSNYTVK